MLAPSSTSASRERTPSTEHAERVGVCYDGFDTYLLVRQGSSGVQAIPVASNGYRQWIAAAHVRHDVPQPPAETVAITRDLIEAERPHGPGDYQVRSGNPRNRRAGR